VPRTLSRLLCLIPKPCSQLAADDLRAHDAAYFAVERESLRAQHERWYSALDASNSKRIYIRYRMQPLLILRSRHSRLSPPLFAAAAGLYWTASAAGNWLSRLLNWRSFNLCISAK
jgi:hypothetical protein